MADDLTELPGVGPAKAEKLKEKGLTTFLAIAIASPKNLAEMVGEMTPEGAAKIIEGAKDLAQIEGFITGNELKEQRKKLRKLPTSSPQLDSLFGGPSEISGKGGIETTSITEFFGEYGSGKTQICFQLAVNATMPESEGGLDGHVMVIDTENTFRPKRIDDMATAQGLDVYETQEKIHISKAFNAAHQMLLMEKKAPELAEKFPIRLVIVDSLVAHFRSEYIGRGNLADRQALLNTHMHDLLHFAFLNNAAVAVTNQVLTNPSLPPFMDPTRPVGGHIVGHTSTYRVYLRKGKVGKPVARMIDSPENPVNDVVIALTEEGVRDG
jgi:DNA repair protein RadA